MAIYLLVRFLSRKEISKDSTIERDESINRDDGYRARHIVIRFQGHYSRSMYPARIEIQLQTALQHAFNFASRSWAYKNTLNYSENWYERFKKISRQLSEMDVEMSNLQEEVIEKSSSFGDHDPLTPFSYQRIVADSFDEIVSLNDAVDITRMLMDVGCNTNGKLKNFFQDTKILALLNRFLGAEAKPTKIFTATIISKMPKHCFWTLFGIRLDAAKEMLDKFESSDKSEE